MEKTTINYMKYKYVYIIITLSIALIGVVYGLVTGYKFDVDFKGGTKIQVDINEEFDNTEMEKLVKDITNTSVLIQKTTGGNNAVSITTDPLDMDTLDKVVVALQEKYTNMSEPSTRNVQASYGKELFDSALIAISIAVVLILLYIIIRFKTLGGAAAVSAILALAHDVIFIIGIYGFIKFPINSTFVAVILTIIGYSINDTIIIYDRIRENKKKVIKSDNEDDIVNLSISQCLGRTIMTSLTTVVAVVIVYVFALLNNQEVLKQFSLPLIIGVLVGTYSSLFVASPLWLLLENVSNKIFKKKSKKRR